VSNINKYTRTCHVTSHWVSNPRIRAITTVQTASVQFAAHVCVMSSLSVYLVSGIHGSWRFSLCLLPLGTCGEVAAHTVSDDVTLRRRPLCCYNCTLLLLCEVRRTTQKRYCGQCSLPHHHNNPLRKVLFLSSDFRLHFQCDHFFERENSSTKLNTCLFS
jgi:hypothetical protein